MEINKNKPRVDRGIFYSSLILLLLIIVPLSLYPESGSAVLSSILSYTTNQLGWVYLLFAVAVMGLLGYLALGPYGRIRFGDEAPEFSTFSWIGMIFTAGIGSSILYWAPQEWAYYYKAPPFGAEALSPQAAELAVGYGFFHWGLSAWAIFCIPSLPIAYQYFVKKRPFLRLSQACTETLGESHANGLVGKIIDIAVIFGILGGLGTTIGLGTPMVSTLIGSIFDIEPGFGLNLVVMGIWVLMFSASVSLGLQKGIKRLSDANMVLALVFLGAILVVGPTAFIINSMLSGLGFMFDNFMHMSLWTDSVAGGGFPQSWTIFYWAWWVSWAPFVSIFIARISRGRTIRETIFTVVGFGSLGCWIYYAVLGNYGLHQQVFEGLEVTRILTEEGGAAAVLAVLSSLPFSTLAVVVYTILAFICLATSLDSAAYTLSAIATDNLEQHQDPALWHRIFWAFALAALPLTLILIGGGKEGSLKAIQTSSIVLALPLTCVLSLVIYNFFKVLKQPEKSVDILRISGLADADEEMRRGQSVVNS